MVLMKCKYCNPEYQSSERTILANEYFFANYDNHPVSQGHMKIIPKRHVLSMEELTPEELIAFADMLFKAKDLIGKKYKPDGWNIGYNEGEAAGQTVFHLHIHLIPRYKGDVEDPTGGIRTILPRGNYKL